jgi:peptide/nickel transport system permease protein
VVAVAGGTILLAWLLAALVGGAWELSSNQIELEGILDPPATDAVLGRDALGRPIAERLLVGARVSFWVAASVVVVSFLVGTSIGVLSAWLGGWVDHAIVRFIDLVMAFPGLLLAIALAGVLGPGLSNVVIALVAIGWVGFARLARAQTLSIKGRPHVVAARALGVPNGRIVVRHVLPLLAGPISVEATFSTASAVISEATLSFLGLGVQPHPRRGSGYQSSG